MSWDSFAYEGFLMLVCFEAGGYQEILNCLYRFVLPWVVLRLHRQQHSLLVIIAHLIEELDLLTEVLALQADSL